MNPPILYTEAFEQLEVLIARLESSDTTLDELGEINEKAKKLIKICEDKLRNIAQAVSPNGSEQGANTNENS